MIAQLQLALMMLTRLPAGRLPAGNADLREARWAFPLIGVPVGVLCWLAFVLGSPDMVSAALAFAALILVTGGLHFDGLADSADGLGVPKDKALEVMRDSRIGSYGVLALVATAALWITAVASLGPSLLEFILIAMLSRAAMVMVQDQLPPARQDGLGASAAGPNRAARMIVAWVALAVVLLLGGAGFAVLLTVLAVTYGLSRLALTRIGGQTGDVLGAVQLVSEVTAWVVLSSVI